MAIKCYFWRIFNLKPVFKTLYTILWCDTRLEEDEARLSPLRHAHINMLGHYTFTLAEQVTKGQLRPLKQAEETDEWPL